MVPTDVHPREGGRSGGSNAVQQVKLSEGQGVSALEYSGSVMTHIMEPWLGLLIESDEQHSDHEVWSLIHLAWYAALL